MCSILQFLCSQKFCSRNSLQPFSSQKTVNFILKNQTKIEKSSQKKTNNENLEKIVKFDDQETLTDGLGNQTSIKSQRSDTQVTSSNKKTDQNDENSLCPIIQMEGNTLSYVPLRIENEFKQRALIDTGAC